MQFHLTKVQLHSPFAFATPSTLIEQSTRGSIMSQITVHCRIRCQSSAIQIAKIFDEFRRHHDVRYLQCTGIQYAAFGARALIKLISSSSIRSADLAPYLRSLMTTLEDMSQTFKPALKPLEEAKTALDAAQKRAKAEIFITTEQTSILKTHPDIFSSRSPTVRNIIMDQASTDNIQCSSLQISSSSYPQAELSLSSHQRQTDPLRKMLTSDMFLLKSQVQPSLDASFPHQDTSLDDWEEVLARN
jgi:hypothetical protein